MSPVTDLDAERDVRQRLGAVPGVVRYVLPVQWIVRSIVTFNQFRPAHLSQRMADLCAFVTSQENACRYCYGSTRAFLRLTGMSEGALSAFERDLQLAEASDADLALLDFCRKLAQSNPRPARPAYDKLRAMGVSDAAVREASFLVVVTCVANRVATILGVPADLDLEGLPDKPLVRAFRPIVVWAAMRMAKPARRPAGARAYTGPYAKVLRVLGDSPWALHLGDALDAMFETGALGRRASLLVFAVVARGLGCELCEDEACRQLRADGLGDDELTRIVTLLDSPSLTPTERAVIELARNTVRYEASGIQDHARALAAEVGRDLTIEAVGVAGMANAVVRLAMLHDCQ